MEGIHDELMTVGVASSMLDADTLIDLTDDFDDAPQNLPVPGQLGASLLFASATCFCTCEACHIRKYSIFDVCTFSPKETTTA